VHKTAGEKAFAIHLQFFLKKEVSVCQPLEDNIDMSISREDGR